MVRSSKIDIMAIQHCVPVVHQQKNPIKTSHVRPSGIDHRAHGIRHHGIFTCGRTRGYQQKKASRPPPLWSRFHVPPLSQAFTAQVVQECLQPSESMAIVALRRPRYGALRATCSPAGEDLAHILATTCRPRPLRHRGIAAQGIKALRQYTSCKSIT